MHRYRVLTAEIDLEPSNELLRRERDAIWDYEMQRFAGLIHSVCSRYCHPQSIDFGDYLSAAYRGLERALLNNRSTLLLPGFARVCITNSVIDYHIARSRILTREKLDENL